MVPRDNHSGNLDGQITSPDSAGRTVQTFQPNLTDLQRQVLDLLHVPHSAYTDPT